MASKRKKKAKEVASNVASNAADVANIANVAKANPYIQRLIDDQALRDNVQKAIESGKNAYERIVQQQGAAAHDHGGQEAAEGPPRRLRGRA